MVSYYQAVPWLPPNYVCNEEEKHSFHACVTALRDAVGQCQGAWHVALQWIPIFNNMVGIQEDVYEVKDVLTAVHCLQEVVFNTPHDVETQVRAAQALTALLHAHKHRLSRLTRDEDGMLPVQEPKSTDMLRLRLDWRPWLDLLLGLVDNPSPSVEGFALTSARQSTLMKLVATARRYFAPEAAFDIWRLLAPAIDSVAHDPATAYNALGWAALFTPTFCISSCDPAAVNNMVGAWMEGWGRMPNSPPWSALWLSLLSRAAKHDFAARIDWSPHLDVLFTHFIGSFDVPIGTASSLQATLRTAPMKAMLLHAHNMSGIHTHAATMVASLLRARAGDEHGSQRARLTLERLRHLASLIDNYFHPSNTGRWCRELSAWTKGLVNTFVHFVGKQGATPPAWLATIAPPIMTAFVACMAPLAARGQFSKDDTLSSACVSSLASLAYIAPGAVLPLVVSRFRTAVESQTATHQLAASIVCLSKCIRPLLLSGWGLDSDGETGEQLLAEALMALLPGIDANDEQKTMAVMQFYTTALSSLPAFHQMGDEAAAAAGAVCLPLYLEEWGEEVLSRLLALLSGLDSGLGHRADAAAGRGGSISSHAAGGVGGGSNFLTSPGSFFPHLASLLFSRLPPDVGAALAKRAARFAATELLPGAEQAVGVLMHAACEHHTEVVWQQGLLPLLLRIMAELTPHAAPGHAPPSPSLEATLCYQLGLLRQGVFASTAHAMLPRAQQLLGAADAALAVPSRPVQNAGSALLSSICCVCVRYYTHVDLLELPGQEGEGGHSAQQARATSLLGPLGVEQWVDKHATGCPPPKWVVPNDEALALAEQLIASHLIAPLPRMLELLNTGPPAQSLQQQQQGGAGVAGEGGHTQRMRLHGELAKMKGVAGGLLSTLRDFDFAGHTGAPSSTPISVCGNTGVAVGAPGTRERVAQALSAAAPAILGLSDAECIGEFLVVCGLMLNAGSLEHTGAMGMAMDTRKLMQSVQQPAAADLLLLQRGGAAAEVAKRVPWRKQVPRWVALTVLDQALANRAAMSSFRCFATADAPELTRLDALPPSFRALAAAMCQFATHSLAMVRAEALPIVDAMTKRFPLSLARTCLPHFLCATADVPPPAELAPHSPAAGSTHAEAAMQACLARAAVATQPADAGGGTEADRSQVEKDGRVLGACAVLNSCLSFWRLVFRDPNLFACALHALMASRAHTSLQAQGALSKLMINFVSRFLRPSALSPDSPGFASLTEQMLHLAKPETLRTSWRYSLSANVVVLLLMPAPSAGEPVLPFARHVLELLGSSNMLQLRQLAAATLSLLLTRMVEYGESNPQLAAEVSAWLASKGASLADHLTTDHTTMEAVEASTDKRGGGGMAALQARLLNMTHDELIMKVVAFDRTQRTWPEGGHAEMQPQAVRDGLFVVSHARLVSLLARVAPHQVLQALQPALEQAARTASSQQVVAYTSEKAVQAAAAEATAGLLCAGASWAPGAPGGDKEHWLVQATALQLQTMSLEMSESWSLAIRYGVHGLLAAIRPSPSLSERVRAPGPPAPPPALPAHRAECALGTMLGLAYSMCPPVVTQPQPQPQSPAGPTPQPPAATVQGADLAAAGGGAAAVPVLHTGPAQLKRLRTLHQCARELVTLDARDGHGLPQAVHSFWASLLAELGACLHHDLANLRQQLAKTLAMAISYLGGPPSGRALAGGPPSPVAAGAGLQAAQALAAARAGQAAAAAASAAAAGSGLHAVHLLRSDSWKGAGAAANGAGVDTLQVAARALAADFLAALASATTAVRLLKFSSSLHAGRSAAAAPSATDVAMREAFDGPASGAAGLSCGASDAATAVAVSQVGLAAGVVSWGVLFGDLTSMRPLLLRSLPHLLRLQELAGPATQSVAQETAVALAMLKYLPVGAGEGASLVTDALQGAATPASLASATTAATPSSAAAAAAATAAATATAVAGAGTAGMQEAEAAALAATQAAAAAAQAAAAAAGELWSARAASLSFAQSFWFRSCFLLSRGTIKRLEGAVLSRLADAKPEVRVVAGATLSGMLRGMPETEADALRTTLLSGARSLLRGQKATGGGGRGGSAAAGGTEAGPVQAQAQAQLLLERHGLVQGLKAFLQSSPYDAPAWMPSVLVALARAAQAAPEAALRSSAAKALSEFKRTHEADSLEALKAMMDADEWDSVQQVASPASYFT